MNRKIKPQIEDLAMAITHSEQGFYEKNEKFVNATIKIILEKMKKDTPDTPAIDLLRTFDHICPRDFEEIMEYFEDSGYLSKKGKDFRHEFWEAFIKEG